MSGRPVDKPFGEVTSFLQNMLFLVPFTPHPFILAFLMFSHVLLTGEYLVLSWCVQQI